jgi:iron(III) transport system substrate-binding protein
MAAQSGAVEGSKKEGGLRIYGNIGVDGWAPALAEFRKKYPWISVEVLAIGPSECFERYYAESSVGRRSADIIAAASPGPWVRFVKRGEVEPYVSSETAALPEWSRPFPGLYTLSTDPLVMIYNKMLLPAERRPNSLAGLVALSKKYPSDFAGRITTYDADRHPFAFAIHWTYTQQMGEGAWDIEKQLIPITSPEGAGASMVEKLAAGEYTTVYFGSPLTFFHRILNKKAGDLIGWSLIKDAQPIMPRGIGITKASKNKFSAQLFVDYVLSREGQIAIARGGMIPYRADVRKEDVPFLTYSMVRDEVGEKNLIVIGYDEKMIADNDGFLAKWRVLQAQRKK